MVPRSGLIVIVPFFLALVQVAYSVSIAASKSVVCSNGQTVSNAACCGLFPVVALLQNELFDDGECNEEARASLRLAFHDAIGFSKSGGKGGGADGSILEFAETETAYAANVGIDDITNDQFPVWRRSGLTAGDFVHLAAAVGTSNCAGAPRLQYQFGRAPPAAAAPDGTVPEPTDSVTQILNRFSDAGFSAQELVALLASHSVGVNQFVDTSVRGAPFDSTPFTFDSQMYLEVLLRGTMFPGNQSEPGEVAAPVRGEMRLQSDFAISQDSRTACFWQSMIDNQLFMMSQFQTAMAKLQTLGQKNLIDCSAVIPVPQSIGGTIVYPPTLSRNDVQDACPQLSFPNMQTAPGPAWSLTPVPN